MAETGSRPGPAPGDRTVIGLVFGNSNSSIAYTLDEKAEVIANEDGGEKKYATIYSYPSTLELNPYSDCWFLT